MKFVKPGDDDESDHKGEDPTNHEETVSLAWESDNDQSEHTLTSATEANATELQATQETIDSLRTVVEEQQEVIDKQRATIESLQSETDTLANRVDDQQLAIQDQHEELTTLRKRLAALQDIEGTVEDLDTRIDQLEAAVPNFDDRITETERHVARLRAAVLEEKQPCPYCDGGHITLSGGVIDPYKLVCDQCDYEGRPRSSSDSLPRVGGTTNGHAGEP